MENGGPAENGYHPMNKSDRKMGFYSKFCLKKNKTGTL